MTTPNCETPKCPACGLAGHTLETYGHPEIHYDCGSVNVTADRIVQSDRCKLTVAERRLAEEETEQTLLHEEIDGLNKKLADVTRERDELRRECVSWRQAYVWAYRMTADLAVSRGRPSAISSAVTAVEMRAWMRAQAGTDLTDPDAEVEQWETEHQQGEGGA